MSGQAADERFWWENLNEQEIDDNTAGYPPYDVDEVARRILNAIGPVSGFARLLDLGCGVGRLTERIARMVTPEVEIVGVDISRTMIDKARRWPDNNVLYRVGDGRTLPEQAGQYDGVWSVAMFQHIPHEAKMVYLADVYDHLRPGGVFLFTVAVGDEDMFLNHQLTDTQLDEMLSWMSVIFDTVTRHPPDINHWTWIEAHK